MKRDEKKIPFYQANCFHSPTGEQSDEYQKNSVNGTGCWLQNRKFYFDIQ